jgi:adenosine deaminase
MDYMRDNHIAIESCITSNYQTGTVTDIDNHPIKTFLANDLLVCLNTDDPAVQNIELKHEFKLASSKLKLTDSQISQLQQNALNASFLSENEKQTLLKQKQN